MSTVGDDDDGGGGGAGGAGGGGGNGRDRPSEQPPSKRAKPILGAGGDDNGGDDGDDGGARWDLPDEELDAHRREDGAAAAAAPAAPAAPAPERRYLVMPGNYSGDSWHIAAAMLLDPNIRLVIPTKRAGRFAAITAQARAFFQGSGIAMDRVTNRNASPRVQQLSEANAATLAAESIRALEGRHANPVTGWTYASTSVIAEAIRDRGAATVQQELRRAFAADPGDRRYEAALATIAANQPCVLVNMRRGVVDNHPQHNITQDILDQICRVAAAQVPPVHVVRVGRYQNDDDTPGGEWMDDLDPARYGPVVEIFPPGQRADRRATAFFWSQVQALQAAGHVSGIIGGRSGSLDVAAFMGVRTFCWDIQNAADHEYARLCVARDLMSIGQRDPLPADMPEGETDPAGGLNDVELGSWLAGNVVAPAIAPGDFDRICRLTQLTGHRSTENRKALLMRPPAPVAAAAIDEDGDDDPRDDGDDAGGGGPEHPPADDGDGRPRGDAPDGGGMMFGAPAQQGAPSDAHLQAMALQRAFAPPPALVPPSVAVRAAPMEGVVEGPLPAAGPPRGRDRSRAVNTNSLRERSDRSRSPQRAPDGAGAGRQRERSRRHRSRSRSQSPS